ncbi:BTAD domain-containing putative transcriptional regulator [Verrucosispora sp. WMMA2121]|uniref:BTAD domain-containing putative transcriptional regulator n=1 Tax=Verrucosispora sp. WMMA2121 TaxID=3015164 RepID=UPI0022B620F2|nr:BTAD domain-containing putative transcriptional regulator [Verrucosispora sp. WMMA2121]MCZ7423787.1 BTAD domain-containing putative transcriptional regulator [Verrucosispora sp. WMMA2121]MCZ7424071.1 BTAD domain-containing putative transcriptional regulator [Verrucosispora sp. WMMA2121]
MPEAAHTNDRLTEYGTRPTVYHPRQTPPPAPRGRAGRVIRSAIGAVVYLLGVPALLWLVAGNPLQRLPTWAEATAWIEQTQQRLTIEMLTGLAVWALWLLWATFALLLIAELVAVVTRWRIPMLRLPAPLHRMVFGLAGTAALAVTSTHLTGSTGSDRSPVIVSTGIAETVPQQAIARGPAIIRVADTRYVYTVERHDTLSKIAAAWLGDTNRWPDICALNKHRHFPTVGGTLRDCDLIYPGWELRLPPDATPPADATPAPPRPRQPADPPSAPAEPSTPTPAFPDDEDASSEVESPTTPTAPDVPLPDQPTTRDTPKPSAEASSDGDSPGPASEQSTSAPSGDRDGLELPGGNFLPWALAAAISAAAALTWLQRRRRFIPHEPGSAGTDNPPVMPQAVAEVHRHVVRNRDLPAAEDLAPRAGAVTDLSLLPPGGVGLVGDGADAAARAALVAMLVSGGPREPNRRGEVVIDHATLATLTGLEPTALTPWPRLHVADDLDHALNILDAMLLHRTRILDEQSLTDLDDLHHRAPDEEALPPVLLISPTPAPDILHRVQAALSTGSHLAVTALLLGTWPPGPTITVTTDGRARNPESSTASPLGERIAVLDGATAVAFLTTLREAQTGETPTITSPAIPAPIPLHTSRTQSETADEIQSVAAPPASDSTTVKAQLRVLGSPRIDNITRTGRPLRAKALELAVYLAVHPDGAATREIGEYLEPDARISQADQRVHTNASNLRHVLGRAGTADTKNAYVIKVAGRYRLDPATVDIDVWRLRDLMRDASIATEPRRRELLTAACDLYNAPLADGQDYEWLQPHREAVRRWGTEAHLLLADDLLDHDPQAASDLLDKAIGLDRYNEATYRKAMRARHALGDTDGIRTLLRALTKALADIDTEPQEDTITLATQLRVSLRDK